MPISQIVTNSIANGVNVNFTAGSAAAPSVTTTGDTNTGIFFPAADTIAFAEGGAEVARFDSSGNLLVGTTSASGFDSGADNIILGGGSGNTGMTIYSGTTGVGAINFADGTSGSAIYAGGIIYNHNTNNLDFATTDGSGRMRINSSGSVLIGKTTTNSLATVGVELQANGTTFLTKTIADGGGAVLYVNRLNVNGAAVLFYKDTTEVGNIAVTGSATSYNSGSDYRLKNDIQPISNALQKVAQLKPSTWTWKSDNTYGDGFVAHELAEVCPNAVTGEKDAVNEDGTIRPQGVDTSFLVATLTAAIQELKAEFDEYKRTHP